MSKHKLTRADPPKTRSGWPLIVYAGIFLLGLTGYLLGQVVFAQDLHPMHWLSGLVGAVVGWAAGWLWYQWRGDIV